MRNLLIIIGLLFYLPPAGHSQSDGRSLFWRELSVQAHLDADGRLLVRERQAMVFDGDWNGGERGFEIRTGQELRLASISRIDPNTGAAIPLTRGELDRVDRYDWFDGGLLRWRSRLPTDPPFAEREIVYQLEYTLWPVVVSEDDGAYSLRHDFAFADRAGAIERFEVELTLDPAWSSPSGSEVVESATNLLPGRGYVVAVPLRYQRAGRPAAVAVAEPAWLRVAVALTALLIPVMLWRTLRRRDRELDAVAPLTPPSEIDERWLDENLFHHPPEIIGASWDRSTGAAEVAALLARLVSEGKLKSRVEGTRSKPILHLQRIAPLSSFEPHERELLESLFFDGRDQTDTESIRKHYEKKGFDPATKIDAAVKQRLEGLPGDGRVERPWGRAVVLLILGLVALVAAAVRSPAPEIVMVGFLAGGIVIAVALVSGGMLGRVVTGRSRYRIAAVVAVAAYGALVVAAAMGRFWGEGGLAFYQPGALLLVSLIIFLAGVATLSAALARPGQTAERLAFRRRLVSARDFFRDELKRPDPRLSDAWYPYLLAFGLGTHVDTWFQSFGGRAAGGVGAFAAGGAGHGSGGGGGGWTGGGPQFGGGGGFGGGGFSGAWGAASVGMASGVSAPSSGSGGGGGGGGSSGGGSGGGW